jgi:tRNA threonylcarbamoyladenosine biosynthesis protein TsaB
MLVVALDTTTRAGSHALIRDGVLLEVSTGDVTKAHAERLPGELTTLLARHACRLQDVDLFAVAAGPGSFTGLRIGIASMQGLAFATERPVIGISALDALARAAGPAAVAAGAPLVGAWMDGQRGEVFAALYRCVSGADGEVVREALGEASVGAPGDVAAEWIAAGNRAIMFVGDGALRYRDVLESFAGLAAAVVEPVPALAPEIGALAVESFARGGTFHPHAIVPIYIRRTDAELARDRKVSAG